MVEPQTSENDWSPARLGSAISMSDDLTEREAKLGATRQFSLPDLRDLVKRTKRLPKQRLVATYFDTPDFRLWTRQITLRHRMGDDGAIGTWTLKLPQSRSGLTLDRTELEWIGHPDLIPDRANQILRGIVRNSALQPIATLETIRRRLLLEGSKHIPLAELDDDAVTIHGGRHDGDRFRQIEIELHEADSVLLEKCVDRLHEAGAWVDDRGPKLARALDKVAAKESVNTVLGRKSTTADVVRASIQSGFNRIMDHEYVLRLENENPCPEAIHQTRVAARRLRSDLQTFKPLLDPVWVRHVRSDLQWLGGELGLVRDADVLGQHLDLSALARSKDAKGVTDLREQLESQRSGAAEEVASVLESERYLLLLDKLHAAAERPPLHVLGRNGGVRPGRTALKTLPKLIKKSSKTLRKRVQEAGREPTDRHLHQIRIGAKRLRYAAEAAEAVVGKRARRLATAAEGLQTQLGEHHDAVIAEAWLRNHAKGASSKVAFSAGRLAAEQIRRQQGCREG